MECTLPAIITRFSEPSKMDTAQFGTICRVSSDHYMFDLYMQNSHNEEDPNWILMVAYECKPGDEAMHDEILKMLPPSNKV